MPQYTHSGLTSPDLSVPVDTSAVTRPLVLVVDANETSRSVLSVALGRDGFEVDAACSALEALDLVQRRAPDAIVVESDLAGDDGFSLVSQLRGDNRLAQTPVLLLAAPRDRDIDGLAEVVGVDACLQKPAYARDVVALLRLERARRSGTEEHVFDAATLPPAHLLRALLSTPRSGQLTLARGHATVRFGAGKVVDVAFDAPHSDIDALVRALALTSGSYSVRLGPTEGTPSLRCGLRELVTLVMPRLNKFSQVRARSLPLDSRMVVDFKRLTATLSSLPDGINALLQLFDGYRTVEEVLIDSPINETLSLEAATRLFLMGVLASVRTEPELPEMLVTSPRLFEPRPDEAGELLRELFSGGDVTPQSFTPLDPLHDWFEEPGGTGLDVAEPTGGWVAGPPPSEELLSALPEALQQQLTAFNIHSSVEVHEPRPAPTALAQFVSEGNGQADDPMATALLAATEAAPVQLTELAPAPEPVEQRVSPVPVVHMPYVAPTPAAELVPVPRAKPAEELEESFFREEQAPAHSVAEAVGLEASSSARGERAGTSQVRWVFIGLAIVTIAVCVELLVQRAPEPQSVEVSPVAANVVVAAPVVAAEEPVAVQEEPAPPPEQLDISDNLHEARQAYEAGNYAKATAVLQQSLIDAPRSTDAWMLYGLVRYDARDVAAARTAVARVLEIDPNNARVQILIASMAFDENDRDSGRAALEKYLALEPNGPHANEARALLARH